MRRNRLFIILLSVLWTACGPASQPKPKEQQPALLPYLGEPTVISTEVNGQYIPDTIYPHIPPFTFLNQEGDTVTEKTYEKKIYVADFFFTTCPTICPIMKSQMLRIYEAFQGDDRVMILSHSIDPEHDSVAVLKEYADRLQVKAPKWNFITGVKDSIYSMAEHYMVSAEESPNDPGGYIHSGAFVLIDSEKHIRGYYDGTKPEDVDLLIRDIPILLNEEKQH